MAEDALVRAMQRNDTPSIRALSSSTQQTLDVRDVVFHALRDGAPPRAFETLVESPQFRTYVTSEDDALSATLTCTRFDVADVFLSVGARITPAVMATAVNESVLATQYALQHGGNVNAYIYGETPLHIAASKPLNARVLSALVDAGAHVDARALGVHDGVYDGKTPLMHAVTADANNTRTLLNAGADANARATDMYGTRDVTPLISLAQYARTNVVPQAEGIVQELVAHGADVNAATADGNTALMIACSTLRDGALIHALLKAGAAVLLKNAAGRTAADFAVAQRQSVVDLNEDYVYDWDMTTDGALEHADAIIDRLRRMEVREAFSHTIVRAHAHAHAGAGVRAAPAARPRRTALGTALEDTDYRVTAMGAPDAPRKLATEYANMVSLFLGGRRQSRSRSRYRHSPATSSATRRTTNRTARRTTNRMTRRTTRKTPPHASLRRRRK